MANNARSVFLAMRNEWERYFLQHRVRQDSTEAWLVMRSTTNRDKNVISYENVSRHATEDEARQEVNRLNGDTRYGP